MSTPSSDAENFVDATVLDAFSKSDFGREALHKLGKASSKTFRIYAAGFVKDDPKNGTNVQGCEFEFSAPDEAGKVLCRPVPGTTRSVHVSQEELKAAVFRLVSSV